MNLWTSLYNWLSFEPSSSSIKNNMYGLIWGPQNQVSPLSKEKSPHKHFLKDKKWPYFSRMILFNRIGSHWSPAPLTRELARSPKRNHYINISWMTKSDHISQFIFKPCLCSHSNFCFLVCQKNVARCGQQQISITWWPVWPNSIEKYHSWKVWSLLHFVIGAVILLLLLLHHHHHLLLQFAISAVFLP